MLNKNKHKINKYLNKIFHNKKKDKNRIIILVLKFFLNN